jgi:hypothetical protein
MILRRGAGVDDVRLERPINVGPPFFGYGFWLRGGLKIHGFRPVAGGSSKSKFFLETLFFP